MIFNSNSLEINENLNKRLLKALDERKSQLVKANESLKKKRPFENITNKNVERETQQVESDVENDEWWLGQKSNNGVGTSQDQPSCLIETIGTEKSPILVKTLKVKQPKVHLSGAI